MRRREGDGCPVAGALQMVGDKWTMLVVRDLASGARRMTDILDGLYPISSRTLVQRLRDMENDGLLERKDYGGNPPRVEYALAFFRSVKIAAGDAFAGNPDFANLFWLAANAAFRIDNENLRSRRCSATAHQLPRIAALSRHNIAQTQCRCPHRTHGWLRAFGAASNKQGRFRETVARVECPRAETAGSERSGKPIEGLLPDWFGAN